MKDTRWAGLDRFGEKRFVDPFRQQAHPILPERRYRDGHPKGPEGLLNAGGNQAPVGNDFRPFSAGEVRAERMRPLRSMSGDGAGLPGMRRVWWLMRRPPRRF